MEPLMIKVQPVYRGRVVNLDVETVTLPNGATVELEIIHHPGASAVVPIREDGNVLLIRQYRHAVCGFIYEIPAGKLNPGEDPRDCAQRELEEEIGYRATAMKPLLSILTTPGFTDERIHIFRATGLVRGKQDLEADEILEVVAVPLAEAIAWIAQGVIQDGKTIIALQAVYLNELRALRQAQGERGSEGRGSEVRAKNRRGQKPGGAKPLTTDL
jgi:ADP-ribose pyrophosphatase